MEPDIDVAIIGAGVSGIDAAYHVQSAKRFRFQVFEARSEIGGTWSLFNYSGVRSDLDMFGYQFPWRPWNRSNAIAEGHEIKAYLKETAQQFGLDKHIQFNHKISSASYSSKEACWTLKIAVGEGTEEKEKIVRSRFLYDSSGYYNHYKGYFPDLPGQKEYRGKMVYPQFWPGNFSWKNKDVVIVGSGATAVSLLPAMAREAGTGSVTILQRSPSYYMTVTQVRPVLNWFCRWIPFMSFFARLWSGHQDFIRFILCRINPDKWRAYLLGLVEKQLPPNVPLDPHFTPKYNPWEQRVCFVPDGEFFKALAPGAGGKIATGAISSMTEDGIQLEDGTWIHADIVVQATGLELAMVGNVPLFVDGKEVQGGNTWWYRGVMLSDVPNYAMVRGSFFQAYTLASDIGGRYLVRLLKHMQNKGYKTCVPVAPTNLEEDKTEHSNAGYWLRGAHTIPKISVKDPWKPMQEWFYNWCILRFGNIEKDMKFSYGSGW